jgi:hypothetical protein
MSVGLTEMFQVRLFHHTCSGTRKRSGRFDPTVENTVTSALAAFEELSFSEIRTIRHSRVVPAPSEGGGGIPVISLGPRMDPSRRTGTGMTTYLSTGC